MEEIFVAIMCIFAVGVGVWTWWYENYSPVVEEDKKEESAKEAEQID